MPLSVEGGHQQHTTLSGAPGAIAPMTTWPSNNDIQEGTHTLIDTPSR